MSAPADEGSREHLGGIARGGALNLAGAAVAAAANFGLIVVVANALDERSAGSLFAVVSVFLILEACTALGTDSGLARFMLRLELTGRADDVRPTLRVAGVPVLAASVGAAVLLVSSAGAVAPVLDLDAGSGATMLRVVGVALPLAVAADFGLAMTRAFGRMRPTVAIDGLGRNSLQVGGALVVAWAGAGAVAMAAAWAAPYAVSVVLATLVALRVLAGRPGHPSAGPPTPRAALRREYWAYTAPRGLAQVFQIGLQRADIVLVTVILGPASAALYTVATRFVVVGQFATQAIQRVLQPRLTDLLARDRPDLAGEVFRVATSWSILLAWPVYLSVAVAAPVYLGVFGPGYQADGRWVVVVMALAMMLASAAGPLDTLLLMSGRSVNSLVNTGAALAVDLALCVVLLPRWGVLGAAVAWAVAVVLRNGLALVQVRRDLGVTPFSRAAAVAAAVTVGWVGVPLAVVGAVVGLTPAVTLVTLAVAGCGLVATLHALRRVLELTALEALVRRSPRPAA